MVTSGVKARFLRIICQQMGGCYLAAVKSSLLHTQSPTARLPIFGGVRFANPMVRRMIAACKLRPGYRGCRAEGSNELRDRHLIRVDKAPSHPTQSTNFAGVTQSHLQRLVLMINEGIE